MEKDLRVWKVELSIPRNKYNRTGQRVFNVAAPDIHAAIAGGLKELEKKVDEFDWDIDMSEVIVMSVKHHGVVHRVVADE